MLADGVVDRVHERDAIAEPGQPLPRDPQGVGVAVETDEADVREAGQQRFGVSPHAEGGVDEHRAVVLQRGSEKLDTAVEHHGAVDVVRVHDLSVC